MKVLLEDAVLTNQSHGGCVCHSDSQFGVSDSSALGFQEPKMIQLAPQDRKIIIILPFMVCFPQAGLALPII